MKLSLGNACREPQKLIDQTHEMVIQKKRIIGKTTSLENWNDFFLNLYKVFTIKIPVIRLPKALGNGIEQIRIVKQKNVKS